MVQLFAAHAKDLFLTARALSFHNIEYQQMNGVRTCSSAPILNHKDGLDKEPVQPAQCHLPPL